MTGTPSASKPKRAGSPCAGSRLNSGNVERDEPVAAGFDQRDGRDADRRVARAQVAVAFEERGEVASERAAAVTFPSSPGGSWKLRSLRQRGRCRLRGPFPPGLLDFLEHLIELDGARQLKRMGARLVSSVPPSSSALQRVPAGFEAERHGLGADLQRRVQRDSRHRGAGSRFRRPARSRG